MFGNNTELQISSITKWVYIMSFTQYYQYCNIDEILVAQTDKMKWNGTTSTLTNSPCIVPPPRRRYDVPALIYSARSVSRKPNFHMQTNRVAVADCDAR